MASAHRAADLRPGAGRRGARRADRGRARADAAARARGRTVRRAVERRGARGLSRGRRPDRPRRASSRSFPTAAIATSARVFWEAESDGPAISAGPGLRVPTHDARRDPRARRRDLSRRVLRRPDRPAHGRGRRSVRPLDNTTDCENADGGFSSDPTTTVRPRGAQPSADRELVGFYHSHPDHPAVPSAFDLEHAWPNLSYVIVSVRDGRRAKMPGRGGCAPIAPGFDEEPLVAGSGEF